LWSESFSCRPFTQDFTKFIYEQTDIVRCLEIKEPVTDTAGTEFAPTSLVSTVLLPMLPTIPTICSRPSKFTVVPLQNVRRLVVCRDIWLWAAYRSPISQPSEPRLKPTTNVVFVVCYGFIKFVQMSNANSIVSGQHQKDSDQKFQVHKQDFLLNACHFCCGGSPSEWRNRAIFCIVDKSIVFFYPLIEYGVKNKQKQ